MLNNSRNTPVIHRRDDSSKIELVGMDSAAIAACVANTNDYRHKHQNTPDLKWDPELAKQAGKWATHLMELTLESGQTELVHYKDKRGENLYWSVANVDCSHANRAWYSEQQHFDFDNHGPKVGWSKQSIGHFSQLVWKNSRTFGMGIARGRFGKYWTRFRLPQYIVVARYSPLGDLDGAYKENVEPLA